MASVAPQVSTHPQVFLVHLLTSLLILLQNLRSSLQRQMRTCLAEERTSSSWSKVRHRPLSERSAHRCVRIRIPLSHHCLFSTVDAFFPCSQAYVRSLALGVKPWDPLFMHLSCPSYVCFVDASFLFVHDCVHFFVLTAHLFVRPSIRPLCRFVSPSFRPAARSRPIIMSVCRPIRPSACPFLCLLRPSVLPIRPKLAS